MQVAYVHMYDHFKSHGDHVRMQVKPSYPVHMQFSSIIKFIIFFKCIALTKDIRSFHDIDKLHINIIRFYVNNKNNVHLDIDKLQLDLAMISIFNAIWKYTTLKIMSYQTVNIIRIV